LPLDKPRRDRNFEGPLWQRYLAEQEAANAANSSSVSGQQTSITTLQTDLTFLERVVGDVPVYAGSDQTAAWQTVLDANQFTANGQLRFGKVVGEPMREYTISDTLVINGTRGGVIDFQSSVFKWTGPSNKPMFLLSTQQLKMENLQVWPSTPLESVIETAKQVGGIATSRNEFSNMRFDGVTAGQMQFGYRFTTRYGVDEDNDQSLIRGGAVLNATAACMSIEHSQSQAHRFEGVRTSGVGALASAVRLGLTGGSFQSFGGTQTNFDAVFDILGGVNGSVTIQDCNVEASKKLLRTPDDVAGFPVPVNIFGGRYSIDGIDATGRFIDFNRIGKLMIHGLLVEGPGVVAPILRFWPYVGAGVLDYRAITDANVGTATAMTVSTSAFATVVT